MYRSNVKVRYFGIFEKLFSLGLEHVKYQSCRSGSSQVMANVKVACLCTHTHTYTDQNMPQIFDIWGMKREKTIHKNKTDTSYF